MTRPLLVGEAPPPVRASEQPLDGRTALAELPEEWLAEMVPATRADGTFAPVPASWSDVADVESRLEVTELDRPIPPGVATER